MVVTTIDCMEQSVGNLTEVSVISFHHRAIVASILIALTPIGLFGNALVIIAVIVAKKLRTITNILVISLAVTDLITCLCFPFLSAGLLSQIGSYPFHEMICPTIAGVVIACVYCSSTNLLAIAFVRWYVNTRSVRGHQGIHAPKKVVALVVLIWTESVALIVLPLVLEIGTLGFLKYLQICGLTITNFFGIYYIAFMGIHIAIALTLTLILYLLVLRHVLRHRKQIRNMLRTAEDIRSGAKINHESQASTTSRGSRPPKLKAINKMEVEITKNLFVAVGVLVICTLPQIINLMIPGENTLTIYGSMIILSNSVVNPIIYGFKHPIFKEVFKSLFWMPRIAWSNLNLKCCLGEDALNSLQDILYDGWKLLNWPTTCETDKLSIQESLIDVIYLLRTYPTVHETDSSWSWHDGLGKLSTNNSVCLRNRHCQSSRLSFWKGSCDNIHFVPVNRWRLQYQFVFCMQIRLYKDTK